MTAPHDTWQFNVGGSETISGTCNDATGAPFNLSGAVIEWKLDDQSGTTNVITMTLANGVVTCLVNGNSVSAPAGIVITNPATAAILISPPWGGLLPISYTDQLKVTLATGAVSYQWRGPVQLTKPL